MTSYDGKAGYTARPQGTGFRSYVTTWSSVHGFSPPGGTPLTPSTPWIFNGPGSGAAPDAILRENTIVLNTGLAPYCWGAKSGGQVIVGFPTNLATSLGVSSTVKVVGGRLGIVALHDGVDIGHPEAVNYQFRDPQFATVGTNRQFGTAQSNNTAANASVPIWGPFDNAAPGSSVPWSAALLNRIQASLYWLDSANNRHLKVFRLYADFETLTQPQTYSVVIDPASVGNTTSPVYKWGFFQTEAKLQAAYRVRVFQATRVVPGFDPETALNPLWESAPTVISANNSVTIGTLPNDVAYVVFVKTAISWPGPDFGTPYWWSEWALSGSSDDGGGGVIDNGKVVTPPVTPPTITVIPPAPPSVSVTQQLDLPHYRNKVTVALIGLNLLSSDDSDLANGIGSWVADTRCTVAWASGVLRMTYTGGSGAMVARTSIGVRVKPGAFYSPMSKFLAATAGLTVYAGVRWRNAAGGMISEAYATTAQVDTHTLPAPGVMSVLVGTQAPAGAYDALLLAKVMTSGGTAGTVHKVDEAGLLVATAAGLPSSPVWTPGGATQAISTSDPRPRGSVILQAQQPLSAAIPRTPAGNYAHQQLTTGGGLFRSTVGFTSALVLTDQITFRALSVVPPDGAKASTTGMIEWYDPTGAPTNALDIGHDDPCRIPAVAGVEYIYSAWVWTASGTVSARLAVNFVTIKNTALAGTTVGTTVALTTVPQKLTVTATADAKSFAAGLKLQNVTLTPNVSIFITGVRARPTSVVEASWPGQGNSAELTWYDVRDTVLLPTDGSPTIDIFDHEAPPDRVISYAARVSVPGIVSIRSVEPATVYNTPPRYSVLKDIYNPDNAVVIWYAPGDTAGREEDVTELHPAGRDGDPVFSRNWGSGDKGTLTVVAPTSLDLAQLQQIDTSRPMLVQWKAGGQQYVRIVGRPITRNKDNYAHIDFNYVSQARP